MAAYVDPLMAHGWFLRGRHVDSCHLFADSLAELEALARCLGLKPEWLHVAQNGTPHYDLTASKRAEAIRLGAVDAWADDEAWEAMEVAKFNLREEKWGRQAVSMYALSLWSPWAELFVRGKKKVETRSWPFRKPLPCVLAIHAAQHWTADTASICMLPHFLDALTECGLPIPTAKDRGPYASGGIIGLALIVSAASMADPQLNPPTLARWVGKLSERERALGHYAPHRYAFYAHRVKAFEAPIPCRGRQSLFYWTPPDEVDYQARQMLAEHMESQK